MIANKAHQPQAGQKPRFCFVITFINEYVKIKLNICLPIDKHHCFIVSLRQIKKYYGNYLKHFFIMQIQGKLRQISAPQVITSKTTGKQYNKITFVVEFNENGNQYPQSMALETLNESNINVLRTLNVGAEIIVKFDCEAREYNGKYYNTLKAWSVAPATQVATQPAQQAQPAPAQQPTPVAVEQTGIDGLPF